jgi:hypothetical protein
MFQAWGKCLARCSSPEVELAPEHHRGAEHESDEYRSSEVIIWLQPPFCVSEGGQRKSSRASLHNQRRRVGGVSF